jgi:hypothetical protein
MQAPIAAAVLAAGVAGPALADVSDGGFGDWDVNDDGLVSRQEFQLGMGVLGVLSDEEYRARPPEALEDQDADVWNAWNLDGDDLLEEREVGSGYFGRYDRDGSGGLDRAEWRAFLADAAAQGWLEP